MEIIFAREELISEGIMSMEEGDEIMKREAREVITTEQLLTEKKRRNRKGIQ